MKMIQVLAKAVMGFILYVAIMGADGFMKDLGTAGFDRLYLGLILVFAAAWFLSKRRNLRIIRNNFLNVMPTTRQ